MRISYNTVALEDYPRIVEGNAGLLKSAGVACGFDLSELGS
jgi:hypothetical protein